MFCPECGKKNENGAQFCEHCGAKIAEESKVVLPKTPRKPMKKKTIVIISIVSALVVILVVGGIVLSSNFKPSKIAVNYFVALMNNDTDKIYDYINVPDSEFTTKKTFTEVVDTEKEDLLNYKIVSEEKSTDGLSAQVKISYTLEGDKTPLTTTIYLVKDKKNKLLIFDNWKISDGSSLVEEDYDITVYKGATVKLEGVEVPEKYKEESISQRYDTYVIPAIFKGEYDAEVTLKNGLKTKSVLDTTGYDSSLTDFELSENEEKELTSSIKDYVSKLYKAALEGKSFDDIKKDYEYKGSDLDELEKAYKSFASSIKNSGLTKYSLKDVEISRYSINTEGYLYVTVNTEYDYTVKSYFSDETVDNDDEDTAYLTFDYSDGFKLVDMTGLATYFSRY